MEQQQKNTLKHHMQKQIGNGKLDQHKPHRNITGRNVRVIWKLMGWLLGDQQSKYYLSVPSKSIECSGCVFEPYSDQILFNFASNKLSDILLILGCFLCLTFYVLHVRIQLWYRDLFKIVEISAIEYNRIQISTK